MNKTTPDTRPLPPEPDTMTRAEAWDKVVDNRGLAHYFVDQYVQSRTMATGDFYGYNYNSLYPELIGVAYEAMLKAVETFNEKRTPKLATYAKRVVYNALNDEMVRLLSQRGVTRKLQPQVTPLDEVREEEEWSPAHDGMEDQVLDTIDDNDALAQVKAGVPPDEWALLEMYATGMSTKQVAENLGVTPSAAGRRLRKALLNGRRVLDEGT